MLRSRRVAQYLILAVALLAGSLLQDRALAGDALSSSPSDARALFALTNKDRSAHGLAGLVWSDRMEVVAIGRSKDMIERDYFSHAIPPDGHKVFDIAPYVDNENIGWNNYPEALTVSEAERAFMASAGHRAQILGRYTHVGIGVWVGPTGKHMYTVLFDYVASAPAATPKQTTTTTTAAPTPKRTTPPPKAKPAVPTKEPSCPSR